MRWRRRFFVLSAVSAADSLPGTRAALDYYADAHRRRKRGSVNLSACDEVYTSLHDSSYAHVFALCTKHKRHDRVYLLAADTDSEMNQWISCLCYMLGMKENENLAPVPPERPLHTQPAQPVLTEEPRRVTPPPPQQITPPPPRRPVAPMSPSLSEGYIPLDECYSDSPASLLDIVPPTPTERDAVPKELAPPPPTGVSPLRVGVAYDVPRPSMIAGDDDDDSLYKVPPVARRVIKTNQPSIASWYDVPRAQRNSGSSTGSRSSGFESDPPPQHPPQTPSSHQPPHTPVKHRPPPPLPDAASTYDILPPSRATVVAAAGGTPNSLLYMNIPRNSRAVAGSPTRKTSLDTYDVPLDLNIEIPGPCGVKRHEYVNAPAGYVASGPVEDAYMPMSDPSLTESLYTDMSGRSLDPPITEMSRQTDVSRQSDVSQPADVVSVVDEDDDIYSAPQSNQPVPRVSRFQQRRFHVPRPGEAESRENQICMTHRTKSFRRDLNGDCDNRVILPQRRTTARDSSSDSSDYDTDSVCSHEVSSDNLHLSNDSLPPAPPTPQAPPRIHLASTPPATKLPPPAPSGEVQYLYLDIEHDTDDGTQRSVAPSSVGMLSGAESPTNYKEIDFVKTKALSDMKRALESERKAYD